MRVPFSRLMEHTRRLRGGPARLLLLLLIPVLASRGSAQALPEQAKSVDPQTLQMLLQRIDKLEERVRQLEAERNPAPASAPVPSAPFLKPASFTLAAAQPAPIVPVHQPTQPSQSGQPATPPAFTANPAPQPQTAAPSVGDAAQNGTTQEPAEPGEHTETERMDVSKTLLRIRGFGDVTLHGDNYHPAGLAGDTTAFTLGQLNLFVTSDISDKFRFLSEIVFEAGPDNIYGATRGVANTFGVDVERYLLTYSYNEYFNLSAGRYHTAIGYYNTAYHHSTWLQTTTGRPLLFAFEDQGGILPIHNIGVEAHGLIPSGALGLHYVAEIGNGRESRDPIADEPVQNIITDKNHKAVNFEVFSRPTKIPGLQTGFSVYHDLLVPLGQPAVSETILAAHAVYTRTNFEWLNEALVIRHTPLGGHLFETPGWYSQISQRFGSYRPYFRYQYINASNQEPIFPDIQHRAGPSVGLRYDASESVALKLQYDFTGLRSQPSTQGLALQVGFTF